MSALRVAELQRMSGSVEVHQLNGSVGLGGVNYPADVSAVQSLLKEAGVPPGPVDGRCGRLTIHAIEHYQAGFLKEPDGCVDRQGPTWRRLSETRSHLSAPHPNHTSPMSTGAKLAPTSPFHAQSVGSIKIAPAPVHTATLTPSVATPSEPASFWMAHTKLPEHGTVNIGLHCPNNTEQLARFGAPRAHMTQEDLPVENTKLKSLLVTESVGPFKVTGVRPAVASLRFVLAKVSHDHPDLYALLQTDAMEVCRLQRRSKTKISNHAFGTAVDLKIGPTLDQMGSGYSQKGLDALVPYFNSAGWYWGGGYHTKGREDPMHFECGSALLSSFHL